MLRLDQDQQWNVPGPSGPPQFHDHNRLLGSDAPAGSLELREE